VNPVLLHPEQELINPAAAERWFAFGQHIGSQRHTGSQRNGHPQIS
jgi:hypothetical protein